jgi:hypothetical protein
MNKQLQEFARQEIKAGLSLLPESHRIIFRRMYSHKDLSKDINLVVDDMPDDKLDWAMQQVQNSINKLNKEATNADPDRN